METILIWIVLFLLAGIFLAVKDGISNARTLEPAKGFCVGCREQGLEPSYIDVSPRTIRGKSKLIHSRVEAQFFEVKVPLCRYCHGTYECDAWAGHWAGSSSIKTRPQNNGTNNPAKRDPKLSQYCRICLMDKPFNKWADWKLIQTVWDKELKLQSQEKKNSPFGIVLKAKKYPDTPFYKSSNEKDLKSNRYNYRSQVLSMLEAIYEWAYKARIGYERTPEWEAEKAVLEKKRLEEAKKQSENIRRQKIASEQRAEALREKRAKEEHLKAHRKREEERKAELERQRKIEENKKARVANLTKGIHKPETHESAEAFIRALSWEQVEQLAVDLLEHKGWVARRTQPGADKGIDTFATQTTENGEREAIVQVKDWKNPVGRPVIQQTIGAATGRAISEIFVITTGRFTSDAKEEAELFRQSHKNVCELWDSDDLITTIINMPNDQFRNMVISEGEISSTYQLALNEGYAAELNS